MRRKKEEMSIKQRLELFREQVDELTKKNLMQKGLKASITMSPHREKVWNIEVSWPDEDDLSSFLNKFRLFINNNEPVFLSRIYNNCIEHVKDSKVKQILKKNRKYWHRIHRQGSMGLSYQGKNVTPKDAVDLFINGKYLHIDEEKRKKLKDLPDLYEGLFKHQFNDFLLQATKHIFYMDSVIKKVLDENLLIDDSANT